MSRLHTFDARDIVATRCVDTWCFTEKRKYESVTNLYVNDRWRDQQVAGAGGLLDGLPVHNGIDLLTLVLVHLTAQ